MSATVSRTDLKEKMDRKEHFELVEALAREKFREQHLPGAINLPPDEAKETAAQVLPKKDADIVVYCANANCTASENVAAELEKQGYKNVKRYVEGKQDWIDAGLPIERLETAGEFVGG